jgi:hypothetical protein
MPRSSRARPLLRPDTACGKRRRLEVLEGLGCPDAVIGSWMQEECGAVRRDRAACPRPGCRIVAASAPANLGAARRVEVRARLCAGMKRRDIV